MASTERKARIGHILLLIVHWAIIINLAVEFLYASYVIFVVLKPDVASSGPLMLKAKSIPFDLMARRRWYAIEAWIAFGSLSIYLALTEIGPRLRKHREEHAGSRELNR